MAPIGDLAAQDGMTVMDGSEDRRLGWEEINRTRDEIAARNLAVRPIARGGTGANTAAGARANLGVQGTVDEVEGASTDPPTAGGKLARYNSTGKLATNDPTADLHAANRRWVLARVAEAGSDSVDGMAGGSITSGVAVQGDLSCTGVARAIGSRGLQVTTSYVSAYLDGNGFLGFAPSAERLKQDVTPYTYGLDDACALEVVTYRLRTAVESDPEAPYEIGVTAEQLEAVGLGEFVLYDEAGRTQSVAYERLALVALGALREVSERLSALEQRAGGNA